MKLTALAAALALVCAPLALSACVHPGPGASRPLTPAQAAQRAMLTAETAFNVAATAQLDAKAVGLLTGEEAARADQIRKDAYQALLAVRAVYAAGQAPDLTSLLLLTNQLLALAGKQPVPTVPVPNVPTL